MQIRPEFKQISYLSFHFVVPRNLHKTLIYAAIFTIINYKTWAAPFLGTHPRHHKTQIKNALSLTSSGLLFDNKNPKKHHFHLYHNPVAKPSQSENILEVVLLVGVTSRIKLLITIKSELMINFHSAKRLY